MNVMRFCMGLAALAALAAASAAVVPARADERPACAPTLESAWVRAAPPGAAALAGYAVLRNPCDAPVTVAGVESLDFGMAMIHRSVDEGGVSRMRPAGDLVVAAGGELRFEPGGLHLMLMQPKQAFAEGDSARVRLVLADGRRVFAEFPVRRDPP